MPQTASPCSVSIRLLATMTTSRDGNLPGCSGRYLPPALAAHQHRPGSTASSHCQATKRIALNVKIELAFAHIGNCRIELGWTRPSVTRAKAARSSATNGVVRACVAGARRLALLRQVLQMRGWIRAGSSVDDRSRRLPRADAARSPRTK
jgi:hypothetical protein